MFIDPDIGESINVDGKAYQFTEASNAPGILYAEIGRKAKVYRVISGGDPFALKAFKPRYRSQETTDNTERIVKYKDVPGLAVANRLVIFPDKYPDLIKQNNALAYSILMPWIEGKSWFNYVTGKSPLTGSESLNLAKAFAGAISELEQRELAHCDLSSSNFIFSDDFSRVELIDIEDMFGNGLLSPKEKPNGTGGYTPSWLKANGVWETSGDRFAAGILVSEILGWQFEDVRKASAGDAYFADDEFGNKSRRFRVLSDRLAQIHPELSNLFNNVWYAESLEECPRVAEWKHVLDSIQETIQEPILEVSPDFLNFGEIDLRQNHPAQPEITIQIKNAGGGILAGQVVHNVLWLIATPTDFSCSNGTVSEHKVTLDFKELAVSNQRDFLFEDAITIKTKQESKNLSGSYSLVMPIAKTEKGNSALVIFTISLLSLLIFGILINQYNITQNTRHVAATGTELAQKNAAIIATAIEIAQRATATGQARADFVTTVNTNQKLIYGPRTGKLPLNLESQNISEFPLSVNLHDLVLNINYINPYSPSLSSWDYGFYFRFTADETYAIVFSSDKNWYLTDNSTNFKNIIINGTIPGMNVNAGESNKIKFICNGSYGVLYVNDTFISDLDLSNLSSSGNIILGSGFYSGDAVTGYATKYTDFNVWSIP